MKIYGLIEETEAHFLKKNRQNPMNIFDVDHVLCFFNTFFLIDLINVF